MTTRLLPFIAFLLAMPLLAGCISGEEKEMPEKNDSIYQAGQVWSYKTRPGEEDSTLIIVKTEYYDEVIGNIIHISVSGVRIKNPNVEDGINDNVPHMPFSESAITASVVELIDQGGDLPSFEQGYNMWKSALGGVFTIQVSEAIEGVELGLNQYIIPEMTGNRFDSSSISRSN